jgi:hypothetical protein
VGRPASALLSGRVALGGMTVRLPRRRPVPRSGRRAETHWPTTTNDRTPLVRGASGCRLDLGYFIGWDIPAGRLAQVQDLGAGGDPLDDLDAVLAALLAGVGLAVGDNLTVLRVPETSPLVDRLGALGLAAIPWHRPAPEARVPGCGRVGATVARRHGRGRGVDPRPCRRYETVTSQWAVTACDAVRAASLLFLGLG